MTFVRGGVGGTIRGTGGGSWLGGKGVLWGSGLVRRGWLGRVVLMLDSDSTSRGSVLRR